MKFHNVDKKLNKYRRMSLKYSAVLGALLSGAVMPLSYAQELKPSATPANIQVPAGNKLFQVGHAVGTQDYICLPVAGSVKFILFTPQATLLKDNKQTMTHYYSPNPVESGLVRASWQSSKTGSIIWGKVADGNASSDDAYVAHGAIPWLLVTVVGAQHGANGSSDKLDKTTYIQRVKTTGGVAPVSGCVSSTDVGNKAFVPYTADYLFYKKAN